jgi:hypothetical protein
MVAAERNMLPPSDRKLALTSVLHDQLPTDDAGATVLSLFAL